MYRRRNEPYNRIEQLKQNRYELIGLILGSVFLGIFLNIIASGIYECLQTEPEGPGIHPTVFWFIVLLLSLLLCFAIFYFIYFRGESQVLRLDLVLPYLFSESSGLQVVQQHPYRPTYLAAEAARKLFNIFLNKNKAQVKSIGKEWAAAKENGMLQQEFIKDYNIELVDALIIQALDRFGEDSFGPSAERDWWYIPLPSQRIYMHDLPECLQKNRYLQAWYSHTPEWYFQVPENVSLVITPNDKGTLWEIKHHSHRFHSFGSVTIQRYGGPMISRASNPDRWILGEKLSDAESQNFLSLRNRIEITTHLQWAFLKQIEGFETWATNFLAFMEEALDWEFYLATRSDRLIADFPWKIGDLPRNQSLWAKLDSLDQKLEAIQSTLNTEEN